MASIYKYPYAKDMQMATICRHTNYYEWHPSTDKQPATSAKQQIASNQAGQDTSCYIDIRLTSAVTIIVFVIIFSPSFRWIIFSLLFITLTSNRVVCPGHWFNKTQLQHCPSPLKRFDWIHKAAGP